MKAQQIKAFILGVGCLALSAMPAAAEQIKDSYHPTVNGSLVTLIKDNSLTQKLGGRLIDMDVWAGEFIEFDDNLFNTRTDQRDDVIFSTAAGLLIQGKQEEAWDFRVEGQTQYNSYAEYDEYDGFEGFFRSQGSIEIAPALSVRALFNYDRTYDNIRGVQDIYAKNTFTTGAGVTVSPSPYMDVDLDYTFYTLRRNDEAVKDQEYNEHNAVLRPSYKVTPNTTAYAQFGAGTIDPLNDVMNGADQYATALGLSWAYKDTATLVAELGYKHMEFDTQGTIKGDDSHGSVTGRLSASYGFTTDWTTGLELSYAPAYGGISTSASNSNYVDRTMFSGFLTYSPGAGRFTASLKPFYTYNDPSNNDTYVECGANLGVSYVVTDWFNVNAGYTYSVTDYEGQGAYDRNTVSLGVAVTF